MSTASPTCQAKIGGVVDVVALCFRYQLNPRPRPKSVVFDYFNSIPPYEDSQSED